MAPPVSKRIAGIAAGVPPASIRAIVDAVAAAWDVIPDVVFGSRRSRTVSEARQVAMSIIASSTDATFEQIGGWFCRDRTTVAHAINMIKTRTERNPEFARRVALVQKSLSPAIDHALADEAETLIDSTLRALRQQLLCEARLDAVGLLQKLQLISSLAIRPQVSDTQTAVHSGTSQVG